MANIDHYDHGDERRNETHAGSIRKKWDMFSDADSVITNVSSMPHIS